jgi:serpin B
MVVLLPEDGTISSFESSLTGEKLGSIIAAMTNQYGTLGLPKFQFESKFSLPEQLKALGMEQAFDPIAADFTGISSQGQLVITDVIHQSFVSVDEQGTEAAAATAVIVSFTSAPVETFQLTADSPFIFLIRDIETGAVLFMGRFVGPEA